MLSKILSTLGVAPKTLPQATETLTEAKGFAEAVAALFTAANLNVEQLLASGPESLKAHLESLDDSEALASALLEIETLEKNAESAAEQIGALTDRATAFTAAFTTIGLNDQSALSDPSKIKTAFEAHVSKQATLALAKTGHPPAHVPASAIDDVTPKHDDTDKAAIAALGDYEKLITAHNSTPTAVAAQAKTEFFNKNRDAIYRGMQLRRRN